MAKHFLLPGSLFILTIALALRRGSAATYVVGDTSGWDISTDLDTWASGKRFVVGDTLVFQYSSSHSVSEVKKESYDKCNTTAALQTTSGGNSTVPLSKPGPRYFVCGNRLHCLGGMKLSVNVESNGSPTAGSPATAPQPSPSSGAGGSRSPAAGSLPRPSTKNNNNNNNNSVPSSMFPTNSAAGIVYRGWESVVLVFLLNLIVVFLSVV